jgi:hypothetical protein
MNTMTQYVTLRSKNNYGARPPSEPVGEVLRVLPLAVRQSIRMAFEGRSTASGVRAAWLDAASDVRFLGVDGKSETRLCLEMPQLGDAAPLIYAQHELWPTRPDPTDTGLDLLADTIGEIAARNNDSDRFDQPLLRRISSFARALNGTFQQMTVTSHRYDQRCSPTLDDGVINTARELSSSTPRSQAARIMGRLDMIRASTRSFALQLDDGTEIRGALAEGEMDDLAQFFQQQILVIGRAVFRPSGNLLRIDATEVHPASESDHFFSSVPAAHTRPLDIGAILRQQERKRGIAAIFGRWPGDETDEEIETALREMN